MQTYWKRQWHFPRKVFNFSFQVFKDFYRNYSEEHIQSNASKCRPWKVYQITTTMFIKTGGSRQCYIWENNNQNFRCSLSSMFAFVLAVATVKTDALTSEKYGVPSNWIKQWLEKWWYSTIFVFEKHWSKLPIFSIFSQLISVICPFYQNDNELLKTLL